MSSTVSQETLEVPRELSMLDTEPEADGIALSRLFERYRRARRGMWRRSTILLSLVTVVVGWSLFGTGFRLVSLLEGAMNSVRFVTQDMLPPDLSAVGPALPGLADTVYMSFFGFVLSVVLSLGLAVLGARNVTPNRAAGFLCRSTVSFIRSFPDIVFAIILVAAFGIGPVPGALALGIGGVGVLGKLFTESLEEIDMTQLEGLRAAGAGWAQQIGQGVWPQFRPAFITWSLFRLDLNLRAAAVVGLVGAGGIGYDLNLKFNLFQFRQATTIMLMVFALIVVVEWITMKLREKLV